MPLPVYKAMTDYLALEQSIGGYEAAAQSSEPIENFYIAFAKLLNADPKEIGFVENATRAWNMAVSAIAFQPGDRVLIHDTEYSSNYLSLLRLQTDKGFEIDIVPSDPLGRIDVVAMESMITPQTKAVFLTHVPSHVGLVNPVEVVGEVARKHGLLYILDACQSVGQMRVDVKAIGCDVLCGTGRKFLRGPRGTGFLYVSRRVLEDLHPPFIDLQAAAWTSTHAYTLRPDAKRFECWERFMAGQIALGKAADYAMMMGLDEIEKRVGFLATLLKSQLQDIDGVDLFESAGQTSGIVAFSVAGMGAQDVVLRLRAQNINVSAARVEHARLGLETRGVVSLARASVHYYVSEEQILRFGKAIKSLL